MGRFKKNSPGCKCCGVPPCNCTSIATTDCGGPSYDIFYYTFTMSGLANDDCTACSTWNGFFRLCWNGSDTWQSETSSSTSCGHVAGEPLYTLTRAGGFYTLEAKGLGYQWQVATGSWTCAKAHTLTLKTPVPVPAPCSGVPTTVTLDPCYVCPDCSPTGSFPNRVQVDVAGLVDSGCTNCDSLLNATYILNRFGAGCLLRGPAQLGVSCFFPGQPSSWYIVYTTAMAAYSFAWNYYWLFTITLANAFGQPNTMQWKYSSLTAFDCSVSQTLTFLSQSRSFCDVSGATVTLTPL